ncbi:MAG: hypothetical protein O2819_08985, partial [Planctomycetota bacterium]|nr:hypothetical protein [Planctomycetota bacterium]
LAHSKGARVARAAAVAAAEVTLVAAAAAVADVRAGRMSSAALRLRDPAVEDAFEHLVAQTAGGATRWRQDIAAGDRAGAPRLDADEVESVLVATAAALDPVDASWSWALVRTDQAPLIAVDERTLAAMLDVSPDRPLWRDGQWVAVPEPAAATDN